MSALAARFRRRFGWISARPSAIEVPQCNAPRLCERDSIRRSEPEIPTLPANGESLRPRLAARCAHLHMSPLPSMCFPGPARRTACVVS